MASGIYCQEDQNLKKGKAGFPDAFNLLNLHTVIDRDVVYSDPGILKPEKTFYGGKISVCRSFSPE